MTASAPDDFGLYLPPWSRRIPSLLTIVSNHLRNTASFDVVTANIPQELKELLVDEITAKDVADVADDIIQHGRCGMLETFINHYHPKCFHHKTCHLNTCAVRDKITTKISVCLGQRGCMAAVEVLLSEIGRYTWKYDSWYASMILYGAAVARNSSFLESVCSRYFSLDRNGSINQALGRANWPEEFWRRHSSGSSQHDLMTYLYGLIEGDHVSWALKWFHDHSAELGNTFDLKPTLKSGMYTLADRIMAVLPRPFETFAHPAPANAGLVGIDLTVDEYIEYIQYLRCHLVRYMTTAADDKKRLARRFWVMVLVHLTQSSGVTHWPISKTDKMAFLEYIDAAVSVHRTDDTVADVMASPALPQDYYMMRALAAELV